jgi:hypothetical protein
MGSFLQNAIYIGDFTAKTCLADRRGCTFACSGLFDAGITAKATDEIAGFELSAAPRSRVCHCPDILHLPAAMGLAWV